MAVVSGGKTKPLFPEGTVEQTATVFAVLSATEAPLNSSAIAAKFKQGKKIEKKVSAVLAALARLGYAINKPEGYLDARRVA
jgi:hypothetical protein